MRDGPRPGVSRGPCVGESVSGQRRKGEGNERRVAVARSETARRRAIAAAVDRGPIAQLVRAADSLSAVACRCPYLLRCLSVHFALLPCWRPPSVSVEFRATRALAWHRRQATARGRG